MRRSDFFYDLPERLIAKYPLAGRCDSRLLHVNTHSGAVNDRLTRDLPQLLQPGDLLVLNDTRVIAARLYGHKATGGAVELLIERILDSHRFTAKIGASKTPKPGGRLEIAGTWLTVTERNGELFTLQTDADVGVLIEAHGHIPLPPYIDREDELEDRARYQTVWARHDGAVAAPTAGLHFDDQLLEAIRQRGVDIGYVTLHVGSGTYQRVREEDVSRHRLHGERIVVGQTLCDQVNTTRDNGGRVVAVGTTVVRSLESAAAPGQLQPYRGETQLFIMPGDAFRVVDALLTNFHEPASSLIMLVCAFGGMDNVLAAYQHAVETEYRFLSYGDAMFLAPQ